jgi:hypothetical protein
MSQEKYAVAATEPPKVKVMYCVPAAIPGQTHALC